MIRLPLIITESEKPKIESWTAVIGKGLIVIAVILFLTYILLPLMEQP